MTNILLFPEPPTFVMIVPQYNMSFYLQYLATWPEYFLVKEAPDGTPMGYSKCAYNELLMFPPIQIEDCLESSQLHWLIQTYGCGRKQGYRSLNSKTLASCPDIA